MSAGVQPGPMTDTPLLTPGMKLVLWALVAIGAAVFTYGILQANPVRAWEIYLVNYLFWSGAAVTGAVWPATWRVSHAGWGPRLRGVALPSIAFLPVALLAFIPLIFGRRYLFQWLPHPQANRAAWLNPVLLFARDFLGLLLLFVLCGVCAYYFLRPAAGATWGAGSTAPGPGAAKQGRLRQWLVRGWRGMETERARAERALSILTPVFVILYALVLSLIAFDLVMALDQRFYSTLFGGYYFVTNLYMGVALVAAMVGLWQARDPKLLAAVSTDDLLQFGKLMLGFNMLYGLVFWSQYLVIWYGNLLHEIPWLYHRQYVQPWKTLSYVEICVSLLGPFCILLSRHVKLAPRRLASVGLLILAGMWLERYVLVVPSLWHAKDSTVLAASATTPASAAGPSLPLGWLELLISLGFAALFLLCYGAFARVFPITLGVERPARAH